MHTTHPRSTAMILRFNRFPDPEPSPRNDPDMEKAIVGLWMAWEACASFLEGHQHAEAFPCDCIACEDARGILYMVRQAEAVLAGQMLALPRRLSQLRNVGFPDALELADKLLSPLYGPDSETQEEEPNDE